MLINLSIPTTLSQSLLDFESEGACLATEGIYRQELLILYLDVDVNNHVTAVISGLACACARYFIHVKFV